MLETLLRTKLFVPPLRPNLVPRPQLIARLNQGLLLGHKLTLVSAPAGSGKTTLVSEWIAGCKRPAAWLSLDEGENDSTRFLAYLIVALQSLTASFGEGVLAMLRTSQPPPTESILTALLNEITTIPDDFILVLDDYHAIDVELVDNVLTYMLEHPPPHMHLVLVTREDPKLPLARLRARSQLTELRIPDLRFSPSEAAEFLNRVMDLNLSAEDTTTLETRTEGWIAGLQLAALSMQGLQDVAGFIQSFAGSHRFVVDYLIEEVLHNQPEAIQTFLLQTSILERMCGPLCDAAMPGQSATGAETLKYLDRANLFVIPLDHERRWYRYHHLFRDLLRQRLVHKVSPGEIAKVHVRASEWLEAKEDWGGAFHHAFAAEDVDRAARLAETAWQAMDESLQTGAWLGWVNQLPSSVIRVRPVLCTQLGLANMDAGNIHASEASLRDAEQCLNLSSSEMIVVEKGQFQTLPARIAFARAYNSQSQHRFADAVKYAEMALDLLRNNEDDFLYVQVSTVLIGTHVAKGNLDDAFKLVDDFIEAAKQAGKHVFAIAAAFGKSDILIAQGRLRDALHTYQQALHLAATHNAEQHTAHHHLGLAMLYHEMGERERVAQHLQKGLEFGGQTTIIDWAYRKSLVQAHLKESEGDLDSALDLLDEAQRYLGRTPNPNLRPVAAYKALIYLKQGKLSKAQEWAHRSGLSLRDSPDYLHEFERLTLARIVLAGYQNDQNEEHILDVLGLLERQLRLAETQNRLHSRIEILIMLTFAFKAKGEAAKARQALEQALTLAEPEGFLRIFAEEGKPMVEMLLGLNVPRSRPYAQRILALLEPRNEGPSTFAMYQPLSEPLSERELEVLRLLAQGLSNQEITQKLFIALSTVKGHNLRIFAKLGAKSRTEAVARARKLGLF